MTETKPVIEVVSGDLQLNGGRAKCNELHHGLPGPGERYQVPYDTGWAWMISFSCFVIFYVYCTFDQVVSVLLVDIMQELDTTVSAMSVMFSLNTWFYCISTQLTTNVLLKYTTNRCLESAAAILNALATMMFVVHPTVELLLTASFVKAASKGTSFVSTVTLVGYYFRRRRALAIALGLMGASLCSVTVPPLARYLKDEYGLRGCLLLVSGVELQAVLATMLLRPIDSYRKLRSRQHAIAQEGSEAEKKVLLQAARTLSLDFTEELAAGALETAISDAAVKDLDDQLSDSLDARKHLTFTDSTTNAPTTDGRLDSYVMHQSKGDIPKAEDIAGVDNTNRADNPLEKFLTETIKNGSTETRIDRPIEPELTVSTDTFQHNERNHNSLEVQTLKFPREGHADISVSMSYSVRSGSTVSFILGSPVDVSATTDNQPEISMSSGGLRPKPTKLTLICSWINVIINFELMKNLTCVLIFCIYCLVNATSLSMMYLPSYARRVGVPPHDAALLLTITGTCDMGAKVLSGIIADSNLVKVNILMAVAVFFQGLVSQFLGLFQSFELLIFFSAMQGFLGSVGPSLDTVFIVETLGIQFISKVLPMCSLYLGVTVAVQQLVIGALIEKSGNFVVAFNYIGTLHILAAVLLLSVPFVKRLQVARET